MVCGSSRKSPAVLLHCTSTFKVYRQSSSESQSELYNVSWWCYILVIELIGKETLWNSWIRSFGVCFLARMDNRVFLLSMFLAAKRNNIWQLRPQTFHTRKNDSASYAGYKHGSITFSIVLFFNYICCNNKCIYVLPFTCSVKDKRHILDVIQRIWNHLFLPCYIITSLVKHFLHKIQ